MLNGAHFLRPTSVSVTSLSRILIEAKSIQCLCFPATFCQSFGPLSLPLSYGLTIYSDETPILISC